MKCLSSEEIRADLPVRMAFFPHEAESWSWDEMLEVNKATFIRMGGWLIKGHSTARLGGYLFCFEDTRIMVGAGGGWETWTIRNCFV